MDREKAREYLASIGLVTDRNQKNVERFISAMEVQTGMGAYKQSNRFTGKSVYGITERIAWSAGCDRNLVNRFLFAMLERFKENYDPNEPKLSSVCTKNTLDVISPLQFLYLISRDYADKGGK